MKKLFTFLALVFCLNGKAQTNIYHPFPDSNAVWNETFYTPPVGFTNYNGYYIYFLAGDTIISSLDYKKVLTTGTWVYSSSLNGFVNYFQNKYVGAIRQDILNKKVYFCDSSSITDRLLYNFNLNVGDTLPITFNNTVNTNYVSSIDSILIGTSYRKQFHISKAGAYTSPDSNYTVLIEGIGSACGLIDPIIPGGPWNYTRLNCFSQNNRVVYSPYGHCDSTLSIKTINTQETIFNIYPNPSNGSFVIEPSNQTKQTMQVYDVNGKLVLSQTITGKTSIDASSLNEGVYNISLISNEGVVNKRVVIVR